MSTPLIVHVGHSGQTLEFPALKVSTLDVLRTELALCTRIPAARQVFLTPLGKSLRPQTYTQEPVIFVFDSELFTQNISDHDPRILALSSEPPPQVGPPPDTIANQTSLASWQTLFERRSIWAHDVQDQSVRIIDEITIRAAEHGVIYSGLQAALSSLEGHIKTAEQKLRAAEAWSAVLLKEQSPRLESLNKDLKILAQIPARHEFAGVLFTKNGHALATTSKTTLASFLDQTAVKHAATAVQTVVDLSTTRVREVQAILTSIAGDHAVLSSDVAGLPVESQGQTQAQIRDEIDVLMDQLRSDQDYVNSLQDSTHSVSRASKTALTHTKAYLPRLKSYFVDLTNVAQSVLEQRNHIARDALQYMQVLAKIQSQISRAYSILKLLDLSVHDQHALSMLNLVARLPYGYGSWLVEMLQRLHSANLGKPVLDTELQRRKQWLATVDDIISPAAIDAAPPNTAPVLVLDDLHALIGVLSSLCFPADVVEELVNAAKSLDKPPRQTRQSRTFKHGSIHEAALGSAALLPPVRAQPEDPSVSALKLANAKLQEDLRAQRSRVRKLEDLLHRQTASTPVLSPDAFVPRMDLVSSPQTPPSASIPSVPSFRVSQDLTGQSVDRPRRPSSRLQNEEKSLARRLVTLEGDLDLAKQKIVTLETETKAANEAHQILQAQLSEAQSTKLDIMQNMEAQQREFANVRRNLENDLGQARSRAEDVEDELDRLAGSRDNERSTVDARSRGQRDELDHLRAEMQATIDGQNREIDALTSRCRAENERAQAHANNVESLNAAKNVLQSRLDQARFSIQERDESLEEQTVVLTAAHQALSPHAATPAKYVDLVSAIENLASRAASHVKELTEAVSLAEAENSTLRTQEAAQSGEITDLRTRNNGIQADMSRVREELDSWRARVEHLSEQLQDEQSQLRALRLQFADGETGADSLRQQIIQAEANARKAEGELADNRSHTHTLEAQVDRLERSHAETIKSLASANERLARRAVRSKDVSQRLYLQHTRSLRLLDSLGFLVSHRNGEMIIERASKVGSSTTLTDPSGSLNRTVSLTSPPITRASSQSENTATLSSVHWPDMMSQEEEDAAYSIYISSISQFSINTFCDAIAKRLRDFEYTARKWQKEARSYRDKTSKFQNEAHSKIAVRDFKEGDLALFLPTKGKAVGAWAAFNINAPHHFLYERESMALTRREWLVARVTKVEERIVDSTKPTAALTGTDNSETKDLNPFDLSEGLTWYLVHATEDKIGAPTTPGLGKTTVAAANVDAKGSIRMNRGRKDVADASSTLNKIGSLESRRSSTNSRVGGTLSAPAKAGMFASVLGTRSDVSRDRSGGVSPRIRAAGLGIVTQGHEAQDAEIDTAAAVMDDSHSRDRSRSPNKSFRSLFRKSDGSVMHEDGLAVSNDAVGTKTATLPAGHARSDTQTDHDDGQRGHDVALRDAVTSAAPKPNADAKRKSKAGAWQSLWSLDYEL